MSDIGRPICGKPLGIGTGPISIAAGGIVVHCFLDPGHEGPCSYVYAPGEDGHAAPPVFLEGEAAELVREILSRRGKL